MENKKDIFDRIMSLRILRFAYPFYGKYKEKLLYLFFGVLTTVIGIAVFYLFDYILLFDVLLANVLSWIIAVLFAFFTNRTWVFKSGTDSSILRQLLTFYIGRVATLLIEELILLIFVTLLDFNSLAVKILTQIIIIVSNYIISKLIVFKKE